jgi:crotonobetainyl-CoA:carnitine CoA-transferase CaiB-like acyl-CoA transferase
MERKYPLQGLRVVDFTWVLAGPGLTRMLADHGAEVIKVERPSGDIARDTIPFRNNVRGKNLSGYYNNVNRSKYGVVIDLKDPRGKDLALDLIKRADVIVENFTVGVMERLGLGYEAVKKVKPDIIYLSCAPCGQTGPYKDYLSFGPNLQALAGSTYLMSFPNHEPSGFGWSYSDYAGTWFGQMCLMAALHKRRKTGEGQYIDLSQLEGNCMLHGTAILDYFVNNRAAQPSGNRLPHRAAVPHGAYPCKGDDRWCVISVFNEKDWQAFCNAIEKSEWITDHRFSSLTARTQNMDELDDLIGKWTICHEPEKVMAILQNAHIAAGVVQNSRDLMEKDAQMKEYHFFKEMDHPEIGRIAYENVPFTLSDTPGEARWPAPLLGQDNAYVFGEILGRSEEEINELLKDGIIKPDLEAGMIFGGVEIKSENLDDALTMKE